MNFDVFLSHNSQDKPAVETIAHKLQETYGLKCWLDKWNLIPGEPWQEALEEALDDCQTVAVFVGPNTISPWENEEMRSALETRVHDKTRRVVPVLLPGAPDSRDLKLPRFLTRLTWVDFHAGLDDKDALYRLHCGITGKAPGAPVGEIKADISKGLPPGSYIPFPRNALFTGREADLEKLSALCEPNASNIVISQAINGMGGIGKTQLAVEFAYRYGHRFKGVHWLDLRDPAGLETEIAKNGETMVLQPWPDELPAQVAYTMYTWKSNGPRLLVLDNFEEVELANQVLAGFQHPNLRILLTSRRSDWPANLGLQSIGLKVFTPQESLKFLHELLPSLDRRGAGGEVELKNLAEHLGHLPLALELAGRYLCKHPRLTIQNYIAQLEYVLDHRSMQNWNPELKSLTAHDLSLVQTFALSWELVQDENAQKAFIMAGFLAPNSAIPLEIFESTLEVSGEICAEVLEELFGLGLLRMLEDHSPAIHPLLAEFARRLDTEKINLAKLSEELSEIANGRNHEVDKTGNYALYTPILPHVRAVAEKAEVAKVERAGSLWNSLGYHILRA